MIDNTKRMIHIPFKACEGKPYIFVSYAHDDKNIVFPMLEELYCAGYNVWYDEGIDIDEKYNRVITSHIENCEAVVLFISNLSMSREYVVDIEFDFAVRLGKKIYPIFLEEIEKLPSEVNAFLHGEHHNSINEVISLLNKTEIESFGRRKAKGVTREVATGWFNDVEDENIEISSLKMRGVVGCEETPYAYVSLVPDDLSVCRLILKELFNAGYNIRSCENGSDHDRAMMLASSNCKAIIPIIAEYYVRSEVMNVDFELAQECSKKFITLMLDESVSIPSRFSMTRGGNQSLCIWEHEINDYVSKIEEKLESYGCCIRDSDGNVKRRLYNIPGFWYDVTEDGCAIEITKYVGKKTDVIIEPEYYGLPVKSIGSRAFSDCENLTSVSIPEGVADIGDFAFAYCKKLKSISFPVSVKRIGAFAFYGCSELGSSVIYDEKTEIEWSAFYECKNITVYCSESSNAWQYCESEGINHHSHCQSFEESPSLTEVSSIDLVSSFLPYDIEPYICASYAHRERKYIHPIIRKLREMGYHIWDSEEASYDILNYSQSVSQHIRNCKVFLLFVDNESVSSPAVQTEIHHAINWQKQVVICVLDRKVNLPDDVELLTGNLNLYPRTTVNKLCEVLKSIEGLLCYNLYKDNLGDSKVFLQTTKANRPNKWSWLILVIIVSLALTAIQHIDLFDIYGWLAALFN